MARRDRSEAIAKDRLASAAQAGVDYLTDRQHQSGGWSVASDGEADAVATSLGMLALRSGNYAKVRVSRSTVVNASKFLDSVAEREHRSIFHFTPDLESLPDEVRVSTAVGLLCRMYLGWDRTHQGLEAGTAQISRWKPSTGGNVEMEFNWFASQVLFHHKGESWPEWNQAMRDFLADSQGKVGHERGSWYFEDSRNATHGGRLYATALAVLTLEVYYRYPRIYEWRIRPRDYRLCGMGAIPLRRRTNSTEPFDLDSQTPHHRRQGSR